VFISLYVINFVEIIFLSSTVYYFSLWLKKDKRHNLLLYFYCYCLLMIATYLLHLPTLNLFLLYTSPIALLLFIIFHQEQLQKNFITLVNTTKSHPKNTSEWLENLIRASLHGINSNKSLIVAIEQCSDVSPFVEPACSLAGDLSFDSLLLVIDSPHFDQNKILWCSYQGQLKGVNCALLTSQTTPIGTDIPAWQQYALLMTLKTDTIIFKTNIAQRTFDVVIKGTCTPNIPAHQILTFIKKYVPTSITAKGDYIHDQHNQTHHHEQSNH